MISKVTYLAPLLGSNKKKSDDWTAGVHNAKSLTSLYAISKDLTILTIPPLSVKCANVPMCQCANVPMCRCADVP